MTGLTAEADGGTAAPPDGAAEGAAPSADDGAAPPPVNVSCDGGASGAVFLVPADGASCPTGTKEQALHIDPKASDGACGCGSCNPTTAPSCSGDNLTISPGSNNQCTNSSTTYDVSDGTCVDIGETFQLSPWLHWTLRTPTAGACKATATSDPTKVTTTTVRACVPQSSGAACDAIAAGAKACVPAVDDKCSTGFAKVVFGDGPTLSCGDCTCANTSPQCNVQYYDNGSCGTLRYTTTTNGVCTQSNGATVRGFKVLAAPSACTATAGAAKTGLTNSQTICCAP